MYALPVDFVEEFRRKKAEMRRKIEESLRRVKEITKLRHKLIKKIEVGPIQNIVDQ